MKFNLVNRFVNVAHSSGHALRARLRPPLRGRFQAYNHTLPDRYPWLFRFAAESMGGHSPLRLLSFGCSLGDEVFALRHYFSEAAIKGIDIDPENIAACRARAEAQALTNASFETAATATAEASTSYDAIFCLAVLCLGDLTVAGAQCCEPALYFADFEEVVSDFSRCLKPGGWLWLHTTNFCFLDTAVARDFEVVLEADLAQMAPDVHFGRDNRLLQGERSRAVGFRKRR